MDRDKCDDRVSEKAMPPENLLAGRVIGAGQGRQGEAAKGCKRREHRDPDPAEYRHADEQYVHHPMGRVARDALEHGQPRFTGRGAMHEAIDQTRDDNRQQHKAQCFMGRVEGVGEVIPDIEVFAAIDHYKAGEDHDQSDNRGQPMKEPGDA